MSYEELVEKIKKLPVTSGKLTIIAISGFAGSGKSTLAARLTSDLAESAVVPIDDFITGSKNERSGDWHTFDRERLRVDILSQARPDCVITYRQYHSGEWVAQTGGALRTITPQRYLIIEGCGILHPELMAYYDISVWIDCPEPRALWRAENRDLSQGNDDRALWGKVWRLNDLDYYQNFHPEKLATVTVTL